MGNVNLLCVKQQLFWNYSVDKQRLLARSENTVFEIQVGRFSEKLVQEYAFQGGVRLVGLCSLEWVMILSLQPSV